MRRPGEEAGFLGSTTVLLPAGNPGAGSWRPASLENKGRLQDVQQRKNGQGWRVLRLVVAQPWGRKSEGRVFYIRTENTPV